MRNLKKEHIALGIVGLAVLAGFVWLAIERSKNLKELGLRELRINDLMHENGELSDALTNAQAAIASFEEQIQSLSSTVGTLTKLRDTDPELLQK